MSLNRMVEPRLAEVADPEREFVQECPQCGSAMFGIRGSKYAVCSNCGFKDSCCF